MKVSRMRAPSESGAGLGRGKVRIQVGAERQPWSSLLRNAKEFYPGGSWETSGVA